MGRVHIRWSKDSLLQVLTGPRDVVVGGNHIDLRSRAYGQQGCEEQAHPMGAPWQPSARYFASLQAPAQLFVIYSRCPLPVLTARTVCLVSMILAGSPACPAELVFGVYCYGLLNVQSRIFSTEGAVLEPR